MTSAFFSPRCGSTPISMVFCRPAHPLLSAFPSPANLLSLASSRSRRPRSNVMTKPAPPFWRSPIQRLGFRQFSQFLIADAKIDRRLGQVGPDIQRTPIGLRRSNVLALVLPDQTQDKPSFAAWRPKNDGSLKRDTRAFDI